nr:MAG TPA: hypothetical protein [Caudoviricetes sp.]
MKMSSPEKEKMQAAIDSFCEHCKKQNEIASRDQTTRQNRLDNERD